MYSCAFCQCSKKSRLFFILKQRKKQRQKKAISINAVKLPKARAFCYINIIDDMVDGRKMEEMKIALLGVWLLTGSKMKISALHGINIP